MSRDSDAIIKEMRRPGLLNDIMFKIVFGTQQGVPVLIELINALLDLREGDEITGLELLCPAAEKEFWVDKGPVLDLKARDQKGQQYNIEVQLRAGLDDYIKRSVYYTTRFYSEQLEAGHRYNELKRTVSISLLDFILFDREELHSQFVLWEREQGFQLCTDLEPALHRASQVRSRQPRTATNTSSEVAVHPKIRRHLLQPGPTRQPSPRGGNQHGH
jgi:predicted transposase/invertase (TIGR01784 family)